MAEVAAAIAVAARKPSTWRKSRSENAGPNHRSTNQARMIGSPMLQKPLNTEVARLRSLNTFAATVPIITPIASAGRARRPKAIRMPAAMPDAGQNIATSLGATSKESPSRDAKKYAMPIMTAPPAADNHALGPTGSAKYLVGRKNEIRRRHAAF